MQLLAVAAALDGGHHQILRRNERQIIPHELLHDLLVDVQPLRDVLHEPQHAVGGKERLRQADAAVGRIVERALEPLGHGGHGRVLRVGDDVSCQRADALAAHGVALVRHGGRADLLVLERLFDLPVMLQQADIRRHAARALADGGQDVQDPAVELARIGLPADRVAAVKAELGRDLPVHLVDLRRIAVKQLDEARLRAGRAAAAEEAEGPQRILQLLQIEQQILQPEGRALADGRQLGRLVMRIGQRRHGGIAVGKVAEVPHGGLQLFFEVPQRLAVDDEICVVRDVAARRAQMDDALRAGRVEAVGVDVRHHVVADFLLPLRNSVIVDGADVRGQLVHLLLRDRQAERMLRPGQRHPEPAPRFVAHIRGKQVQHGLRRVARGKRAFIRRFHGSVLSSQR